jgi:hypothetical protein
MLARIGLGSAPGLSAKARPSIRPACLADTRACRSGLVPLARSILAALGLTR